MTDIAYLRNRRIELDSRLRKIQQIAEGAISELNTYRDRNLPLEYGSDLGVKLGKLS